MPEKCLTVSQKDTCPGGMIDAKCVPYTGPNLPNLNVTSGQKLEAVLIAVNTAVGGGSPNPARIVGEEFSSDGTYALPSGAWLFGIAVSPSSPLAAFKVGTTPGGNELVYEQLVPSNGEYSTFNTSKYTGSSLTLYFGGITSSTDIALLLI